MCHMAELLIDAMNQQLWIQRWNQCLQRVSNRSALVVAHVMELRKYVWHAGNTKCGLLPVELELVGDSSKVFSIRIHTGTSTAEPAKIKASLQAGGKVNIGAILT